MTSTYPTALSASVVNHQVGLASCPHGLPTRANGSFTTEPVVGPGPGGVLVKPMYLSLDPPMGGWMNKGKSYIPPVEIGAVMRLGGAGQVIASHTPRLLRATSSALDWTCSGTA